MNLGAFAVIAALQRRPGVTSQIFDLRRAWSGASPLLALLMTLFLLSLTGHPADGRVLRQGLRDPRPRSRCGGWLTVLAVIAMLNAAIAAFYYLRVVVYMFMRDPATEDAGPAARPARVGRPRRRARC